MKAQGPVLIAFRRTIDPYRLAYTPPCARGFRIYFFSRERLHDVVCACVLSTHSTHHTTPTIWKQSLAYPRRQIGFSRCSSRLQDNILCHYCRNLRLPGLDDYSVHSEHHPSWFHLAQSAQAGCNACAFLESEMRLAMDFLWCRRDKSRLDPVPRGPVKIQSWRLRWQPSVCIDNDQSWPKWEATFSIFQSRSTRLRKKGPTKISHSVGP